MERKIAVFVVAGAGLLGGCVGVVEHDGPEGLKGVEEAGADGEKVAGQQAALWTEGCDNDQQSLLNYSTLVAHFSLQSALQTYSTGSERANHFFGVGYDDLQVQAILVDMWRVMTDQNLKIICKPLADPACTREDGSEIWANVTTDDINNNISTITVCPRFFDPIWTPDQEQVYFASPPGILLHEMAHLAGAGSKASDVFMGYDFVLRLAQFSPESTHTNADTFRYYIFNNRW
jgi:hypothetical protein